jgi:hypothetical protein
MKKIHTFSNARVIGHTLDTEPHATLQVEADEVKIYQTWDKTRWIDINIEDLPKGVWVIKILDAW